MSVELGPAVLIGAVEDGFEVFRGIQYAHHPVYVRRLTLAEDYTLPEGTFRCFTEPEGRPAWLSIWRPVEVIGHLPVVVWVGDRPGPLADCVYVRISFPEDGMGIFWTPDASHPVAVGHSYILSALRWINRNIAAFGGDPANVTLGGGSEALRAAEDAAGLVQKLYLFNAGGLETRWRESDAAMQFLRLHRAVQMAAPSLAAEQDRGPTAPHWYVDSNRVLRDPQGYRRIIKGAQFMTSTLTLFEERTDYRYRTRFGQVQLHDGSVISAGPGTGVSEPTYAVKLNWRSPQWAADQIGRMAALGINCIQVNVEPAMQFVPPYIDPINRKAYPSEMEVLDQVIESASLYGMAVQIRQANDRCPDQHINDFMVFLAQRYIGRDNVWLNPANEINCFNGGPICLDAAQWAADMRGHIQAIRGAGWTAPITICGPAYSGDPSMALAQMDADPVFYDDPSLIFGVHSYKRNNDPDFVTARQAECELEWRAVLDGRYCAIIEESGVNNLGIINLDPELNPPNPSSNPGEWSDTVVYFQQFFRWIGDQVARGNLHGFIAFNWGSWSGSRNRDNGLTRIGTDGGLTGWGEIYRDEWLLQDYAPIYARMDEAIAVHGTGEALRRFLRRDYLTQQMGEDRAALVASGIRDIYPTGVEAAATMPFPAVIAATREQAAEADALAAAWGQQSWRRSDTSALRSFAINGMP